MFKLLELVYPKRIGLRKTNIEVRRTISLQHLLGIMGIEEEKIGTNIQQI